MSKTKIIQNKQNYLSKEKYKQLLTGNYFENETESNNPVKSFFHINRMNIINSLALDYFKHGMTIIDIGCGNSLWNKTKLPVIGFDASFSMLRWGIKYKYIKSAAVSDLGHFPVSDDSADIAILSEVLEHILDYDIFILNLKRILKKNAFLLISVPDDTLFSLWKPLFKIQCIIQKYIKKNLYYFYECGHVNKFSKKSLDALMNEYDFKTKKLFISSGLSIIGVFQNDK